MAKPAAAARGKAKKPKRATDDAVKPIQHGKRHEHTASEPTGAGERAAAEPGRRARQPALWAIATTRAPKWAPRAPDKAGAVVLPAPTAVALELRSARALAKLRTTLKASCLENGLKRPPRALTFERWRFAAKLDEVHGKPTATTRKLHPVLPSPTYSPGSDDAATEALALELHSQGLLLSSARHVAAQLATGSAAAAKAGAAERHQAASGKAVAPPPLTLAFNKHTLDLKCGKQQVQIGRSAYGKLALLHRAASAPSAAPPPAAPTADGDAAAAAEEQAEAEAAEVEAAAAEAEAAEGGDARSELHSRMFALLLRYQSIHGHGFQAALAPAAWRVLRRRLDVGFECFASPLNAYLPAFASGFFDVDQPFGSRGSFFALPPMLSGSFAANPPFEHSIMDATAARIEELLTASAAAGDHALSFAVFVPGWKEGKAYAAMAASKFLRRQVLVAAADHGFCDGASHQRQDPYRKSPYDTVCFVLQTAKAARKWPVGDGAPFEAELRAAMARAVPRAPAAQRQKKRERRAEKSAAGGGGGKKRKKEKKAEAAEGEGAAPEGE